MVRFDIKDLNGHWESVLSKFGIDTYPGARTKGQGPCPIPGCGGTDRFHYTNKHNNGTWLCRQCTPNGSTGFNLLAKAKGWDPKRTYQELKEQFGSKRGAPMADKKKQKNDINFKPLPIPEGEEWDFHSLTNRKRKYTFIAAWDWMNLDGTRFGYLARLQFRDTKLVWQVCYGTSTEGTGWHQVAMRGKPLVNLQAITEATKKILVVEGEKTAYATQELMGDKWAVICVQGGSSHEKVSNLTPLIETELPVYFWADNDSNKASQKHMQRLVDAGINGSIVDLDVALEPHYKDGWDLADAIIEGWTREDVEKTIFTHAVEAKPTPRTEAKQAVLAAQEDSFTARDELIKKVKPLGVYQGKYVFYPKTTKAIKLVSDTQLASRGTVLSMCGRAELYKCFPKTSESGSVSINYEAATDFLMNECSKQGLFSPSMTRGVGVWRDRLGKDIVINTGTELIVNGVNTGYDDYKTSRLYQELGQRVINIQDIATEEDLEIIKTTVNCINWTDPFHGVLILGFLVQACIAPTCRWRSHLWLNGVQGCGKSFFQHSFVRPLLGSLCLGVDSETTAAGIRQKLGANAFAVSFDEAEVRTEADNRRMRQILSLARVASSDEGATIKGSAGGEAIEYRSQSCFVMSSVKPFLEQQSDITRFALLELKAPEGEYSSEGDKFRLLQECCDSVDNAFSSRFIAYSISKVSEIDVLLPLVKTELHKFKLTQRLVDQFSQLIACAMVIVRPVELELWIKKLSVSFDQIKQLMESSEEEDCLGNLMNKFIKVPMKIGQREVPLRTAIDMARKGISQDFEPEEIRDTLLSLGIKIEGPNVLIANNSENLHALIGYPNWSKLLRNIPGVAASKNTKNFGNLKQRASVIPLQLITQDKFLSINGDNSENIETVEF